MVLRDFRRQRANAHVNILVVLGLTLRKIHESESGNFRKGSIGAPVRGFSTQVMINVL